MSAAGRPAEPEELPAHRERWRLGLRFGAGIGATIWLLIVWYSSRLDVAAAEAQKASAIQITQLYAGAALEAIIAIGLCVALYVVSRVGE